MRYYTNTFGEKITVSDDHIKVSTQLYEELKKNSPSGRVNWKTHKRLMEENGFDDSDYSENYRRLIKASRYENGTVPTIEEYKNLVADEKLDLLKSELGILRVEKEDVRQRYTQLNRLVRDSTKGILLTETIKQKIDNFNWSIFQPKDFVPLADDQFETKEAVVFISDLHYGYVGESALGAYNQEIAKDLLIDYAEKLVGVLAIENVDKVTVVNLGDLVEGNLRNQSLFDTQLTLSEQTIEATDLVIEFLSLLSNHFEVSYTAIAGNHDRITKNIKESIVGDHVIMLSNSIIERIAAHSDLFTYVEADNDYFTHLNIKGVNILAVHGDRTQLKNDNTLAEQSVLFNKSIDVLVGGHYHTHQIREVGDNKYICMLGSIKGPDDFSLKIGKSSCRSQGIIIVGENNEFEIRQIKL